MEVYPGKVKIGTNRETGLEGEKEALKYYSSTHLDKHTSWVNENGETMLPYDLIAEDKDNNEEFIEVKGTTLSENEDWEWFISTQQ